MSNWFTKTRNPTFAVISDEMLGILADLQKRVAEIEKPREVRTHWEGDHERIEQLEKLTKKLEGYFTMLDSHSLTRWIYMHELRERIERLETKPTIRAITKNLKKKKRAAR
jgi:polyhydroxyalkanoate synthesis regulator phasin